MHIVFVIACIVIIMFGVRQVLKDHTLSRPQLGNVDTFIPSLSLVVDEKPDKVVIEYDATLNNSRIQKLRDIKNIEVKDITLTEPSTKAMQLMDTFELQQLNKKLLGGLYPLSPLGYEKIAFFVRPLEFPTKTITEDQVVIGYTDQAHKKLIEQIFTSFKEASPKYILKKVDIPTNKLLDKTVFSTNKIDNLFVFEALESTRYVKLIDRNMKMEVADYAELIDVHKLKLYVPHAKKKNIDFSLVFQQLRGKFAPVRSILAFDVLVVVPRRGMSDNIDKELNAIIEIEGRHDIINYYEQYFTMHPMALAYAKRRNAFSASRDNLHVLEQFVSQVTTDDDASYEVDQNVFGFHDSTARTFTILSNMIHNLPIKVGNTVVLKGQLRPEENSKYIVQISTSKQSVLVKQPDANSSLSTSKNKTQFEPGYLCYNHPEITSKGLCESRFDEQGQPKTERTYWDKPCEKNTDCPFYQSNKNYPNYRGGCIDGRCEMPVGLKAVAYRLYDEISKPLCYNCHDKSTFKCCEEQTKATLYPDVKGPDYVFELDQFERKQARGFNFVS